MIPLDHLSGIVQSVEEEIIGFDEEYPYALIDDSVTVIHQRLLVTAQMRSYLAGNLATLIQTKAVADKAVLKAELNLAVAEANAVPKIKLADFESAKSQQSKILAATLDEAVTLKKAQRDAIDVKAAVDFVREHLREFERRSHDLNLRVKILYSDG